MSDNRAHGKVLAEPAAAAGKRAGTAGKLDGPPTADSLKLRIGSGHTWTADNQGPSHCGTPMEWKAPGMATASAYSFDADDAAVALPPLWRCQCGFQLDDVIQHSDTLAGLAWHSR